jgi:hypothetical protein
MKHTRIDYVFSYWIFLWYIFYEFKITKYNPKWFITIALIENIYLLFLLFYYKNSFNNIIIFCFINFFIKVIPLWRLRKTIYEINGLYSGIIIFFIYLLWLKVNNVSLDISNSIHWIKEKEDGPLTYHIKKFLNLQ